MSMAYIRKTYGVPAKRGGRVAYVNRSGIVWSGTITGTCNAYLRIRPDLHPRQRLTFHPQSEGLEYLP